LKDTKEQAQKQINGIFEAHFLSTPYDGKDNTILFLGFADTYAYDKQQGPRGESIDKPGDKVIDEKNNIKIEQAYWEGISYQPSGKSRIQFLFNRAHSKVIPYLLFFHDNC